MAKIKEEINATLCFVLSNLEKVLIIQERKKKRGGEGKKKKEAIPLTHKEKKILSKINRNIDANYCFLDDEETVNAV